MRRVSLCLVLCAGVVLSATSFTFVNVSSGMKTPVDTERADHNGDGKPDFAVLLTSGSRAVQFYNADATGKLVKRTTVAAPAGTGFATGDINGDGVVDLVITQTTKASSDFKCGINPGILVYLGSAGSVPSFTYASCVGAMYGRVLNDATLVDVTEDGLLDLVVGEQQFAGLRVYPGTGTGTFGAGIAATGSAYMRITGPFVSADVNADGHVDVFAQMVGGGVELFYGSGTGAMTFSSVPVGAPDASWHWGVQAFDVADLNHDGILDVVGIERVSISDPAVRSNVVFTALGVDDGHHFTLTWSTAFPEAGSGNIYGSIKAADVDADGTVDVVTVATGTNALTLWHGVGDGTLTLDLATTVGAQPRLLEIGDWTLNGTLDLGIVDMNTAGDSARVWTGKH